MVRSPRHFLVISSALQLVTRAQIPSVSSLQTGQPSSLTKFSFRQFSTSMNGENPSNNYTTNEEDQREAARLKDRLRQGTGDNHDHTKDTTTSTSTATVPNVEIAEGAHKYVLISAMTPDGTQRQHFVVSKRGAHYHRNAAEPFVDKLEKNGYKSIDITGGGRIALNTTDETIDVFGYSYGFGLADHALSKAVILSDPRYKDFDVTWSNEGY